MSYPPKHERSDKKPKSIGCGHVNGYLFRVAWADRGIGRSHTLRLARLGADIVINDVDLNADKEFGEKIGAASVVEEEEAFGVRAAGC